MGSRRTALSARTRVFAIMSQVTFTLEDVRTPERLERVLRQFQRALESPVAAPPAPAPLDLNRISLAVRDQLQATGIAPLNLQSLLPSGGLVIVTSGSHADRIALALPPTAAGQGWFESDRFVLYVSIDSSGTLLWRYAGGTYYALFASRPSDLGVDDAGFRFVDSTADQNVEYVWTGTEWVTPDYLQEVSDAATVTVTTVQVLRHLTSGAAAASFGARQLVQLEDAGGATENASALDTVWTNAGALAETSDLVVSLRNAGAALAEVFRFLASGGTLTQGNVTWQSGTGFIGTLDHAITAARTWTFPDVTDTVVLLGAIQTLTSKTLTSPILTTPQINGAVTTTGLTLPAWTAGGNISGASFDLGATGSRFTDGYLSGTLYVATMGRFGTNPAPVGPVGIPNNAAIHGRDAANAANIALILATAADLVAVGDTSYITYIRGTAIRLNTTRTAAVTPANFAANYYMQLTDSAGANFYVPAMDASW